MRTTTQQNLCLRMLLYIHNHIDQPLSLAHLAQEAGISEWHFQRLFSSTMGISASMYIRQSRLKRASTELAFRQQKSILDIAINAGFDSAEAFSRAFKNVMKQSPSAFKQDPDWEMWHQLIDRLTIPEAKLRICHQDIQPILKNIHIKTVRQPIKIAVMTHQGSASQLSQTLGKFIAWRKQYRLPPSVSRTFNLLYADPMITPPEEFSMGLGVELVHDDAALSKKMQLMEIPAGRYACLQHKGTETSLAHAIDVLYYHWFAKHDEELSDFPLFIERVLWSPDVKESDAETNVYLGLKC